MITLNVNGKAPRPRYPWRHAAAVDAARRVEHDWHEVRLRQGPLWGMHYSHQRTAHAVLHHAVRPRPGSGSKRPAPHALGELDEYISTAGQVAIREALAPKGVEIHTYPGVLARIRTAQGRALRR
jgi:hypothetical protein